MYEIKSYKRCARTGSNIYTRDVVDGQRHVRQDVTLTAPSDTPELEVVEYGDYTKQEYER